MQHAVNTTLLENYFFRFGHIVGSFCFWFVSRINDKLLAQFFLCNLDICSMDYVKTPSTGWKVLKNWIQQLSPVIIIYKFLIMSVHFHITRSHLTCWHQSQHIKGASRHAALPSKWENELGYKSSAKESKHTPVEGDLWPPSEHMKHLVPHFPKINRRSFSKHSYPLPLCTSMRVNFSVSTRTREHGTVLHYCAHVHECVCVYIHVSITQRCL